MMQSLGFNPNSCSSQTNTILILIQTFFTSFLYYRHMQGSNVLPLFPLHGMFLICCAFLQSLPAEVRRAQLADDAAWLQFWQLSFAR